LEGCGGKYVYRHEPLLHRQGKEIEFERIRVERDSHLDEVPGFKEFNLLRGPEEEDHTLYASHSVWQSK
jgi:heme-degrading monooxygenase HmoA